MKSAFLSVAFLLTASAHAGVIIDFSENNQKQFTLKLTTEQENKVLAQALPLGFVRDDQQCPNDQAQTIESEQIAVVKGAFSHAGAEEYLLAFVSSTCPGSHAGMHGNLVLVDKDLKLMDVSHDLPAAQFEKVWDADGSGTMTAIVSETDGNQGYFSTWVETVNFVDGYIHRTQFISGTVHNENCGAKDDGSGMQTDAVFFTTKLGISAQQKNYSKKCSAPKSAYKFVNDGPMKDLN